LFAGVRAIGKTEVIETTASRDHTERLFNGFGVPVITSDNETGSKSIVLRGPGEVQSRDMRIPGDVSSAAYFAAAAMLLPGSTLILENVGLNPTRTEFLSVLTSWGAEISVDDRRSVLNEPFGTIHVRSGVHEAVPENHRVIGGARIPYLIDELPLLAVVGSQLPGGIQITDAGELRFKESDRLKSTAANLRAMGVSVIEHDDGLTIPGPVKLRGARIESFGDHRIAMAFSIAALIADGESFVAAPECVKISFPEFFDLLNEITVH
jgi:3-phosphoshikimate 1-carboxyvinyltransferase